MKRKGMIHHQDGNVGTHIWITPLEIVQSLGKFDLDPASHKDRPWDTAQTHYTEEDNGLMLPWFGRVWLNPPYDTHTIGRWMELMSLHNDGIALTFARTDRNSFHDYIFKSADSLFFVRQRIHFCNLKGERAKRNSGAPSVLMAYGEENSDALSNVCLKGFHVPIRQRVIVIGLTSSWRVIIKTILIRRTEADIQTIYSEVETMASDKVRANRFWREKVRQQLQIHFTKIKRGVYGITTAN